MANVYYEIWERYEDDDFYGLYDDDQYSSVDDALEMVKDFLDYDKELCLFSDYKIRKVTVEDVSEHLRERSSE